MFGVTAVFRNICRNRKKYVERQLVLRYTYNEEAKEKRREIMKKFFREFKEFASRGNVLDLAVGVMIGGAFQSVVKSLIDNIISPLIGLVQGKDLSDMAFTLFNVQIKYGAFLSGVINFIIMAFIVFLIVKGFNALRSIGKKKEKEAAPTVKKCPFCCMEIAIEAVRCPHCTSILAEKTEEAEA